jgi:hypothetical protein
MVVGSTTSKLTIVGLRVAAYAKRSNISSTHVMLRLVLLLLWM